MSLATQQLVRRTRRAGGRLLEVLPAPAQESLGWLRWELRYRDPLVPAPKLTSTYVQLLERIVQRVGRAGVGDYLEFGACRGTAMMCAHSALERVGLDHVRLFGFDSFEGLPSDAAEQDEATWQPGMYPSDYGRTVRAMTRAGVDWSRTALIKGWFSDTLTETTRALHRLERASLVMVDCDIYSSTVEALHFCEPILGDYAVFVFDDWHNNDLAAKGLGERRAFEEFLAEHPELQSTELTPHTVRPYAANAAIFEVVRR